MARIEIMLAATAAYKAVHAIACVFYAPIVLESLVQNEWRGQNK